MSCGEILAPTSLVCITSKKDRGFGFCGASKLGPSLWLIWSLIEFAFYVHSHAKRWTEAYHGCGRECVFPSDLGVL
jgi:hypothetical protein